MAGLAGNYLPPNQQISPETPGASLPPPVRAGGFAWYSWPGTAVLSRLLQTRWVWISDTYRSSTIHQNMYKTASMNGCDNGYDSMTNISGCVAKVLRKKGHLPISPTSFLDPLTTHSDLRQLEAELVDFLFQGFPILRKVELPAEFCVEMVAVYPLVN